VDSDTVDQSYAQLQQQAQTTAQAIQALAAKLQTAATAGDQNAREWLLDLKEVTLSVQQEQGETTLLLQSIHALVDNHVQVSAGQQYQPQQYPPPPQYQQPAQPVQYQQQPQNQGGGGGMLSRFLGGGMGRAVMTGAGFGIGDDIINHIF
jgi:hypothetical protein